jgi:hypothetical protein
MKFVLILIASLILTACASPEVVKRTKAGDTELGCDGLKIAVAEAEEFEQSARKERTVTGKNVAAAIFFWPALIGTYSNTEEAINAATTRQKYLGKLAETKGCKI